MKKIYGLYGENGLAVYLDFKDVMKARHYLKQSNCKRFDNYEDAVEYAVEKYNSLQVHKKAMIIKPVSEVELPINFTIYRKDILQGVF